ncbi:hypothetical protein K457DRAFT_142376 [Linnemannia elongata AG-77]|uniref:Uncharacterized protein n=1 Tax=Linnemannia elongata AG-77 TaxID=1314771 RepID=A0A197JFR7_9FUNG|nr:hypothetical protein K457DRAFT_142376 [Linnemannia elongata AG-77]
MCVRVFLCLSFWNKSIGQAYVALSRATSLEGLQVTHFDVRKVLVHQKVIDFYEQIGGVPGP